MRALWVTIEAGDRRRPDDILKPRIGNRSAGLDRQSDDWEHEDVTISTSASRPKSIDGRTRRAMAIKARILCTCRALMKRGELQPAVANVAKAAGVSTKTAFTHFGSVERLRRNALEDEGTREAVASLVFGADGAGLSVSARDRVLHAVVLGSLPEPRSAPQRARGTRSMPKARP